MSVALHDIQDSLAQLRAAGAEQRAPVWFRYLEALTVQASVSSDAVAGRLRQRVASGIAEYRARYCSAPDNATVQDAAPIRSQSAQHCASLQAKLAHQQPVHTLKAVAVLRDSWVKLRQTQRVSEALRQTPEHAGPLNSQRLVVRALETLREVSPEYLEHFMEYVDTVLLLQPAPLAEPVRARKAAPGKTRKR